MTFMLPFYFTSMASVAVSALSKRRGHVASQSAQMCQSDVFPALLLHSWLKCSVIVAKKKNGICCPCHVTSCIQVEAPHRV